MPDPRDNPPTDDIARNAAKFIKAARKRLGLTQAELGAALGSAYRFTITRYETGERKPSLAVMLAIKYLLTQHVRAELRRKRVAKAAQDRAGLSGTKKPRP